MNLKRTNKGLLKHLKLDSGHRRIRVDDLVEFMEERGMRIPPDLRELHLAFQGEPGRDEVRREAEKLSDQLSEAKKLLREVLNATGGTNAVLPVPLWDRIYHWLEVKS